MIRSILIYYVDLLVLERSRRLLEISIHVPEKLMEKLKKDERARDRTVNLLIRTVVFISNGYHSGVREANVKRLACCPS